MKASTAIADGSSLHDTKRSGKVLPPGRKEVCRVWAVLLVVLVKDCGLEPDVSVVLLPAR